MDMPPYDAAPAPQWLIDLLKERGQSVVGDGGADTIPFHSRNITLTSLAGTMRARGMSHAAILAALTEENSGRCDPPLPDIDVETIARSVSRYEPDPFSTITLKGLPSGKTAGKKADDGEVDQPTPIIVALSDVHSKPVPWLWRHWIPAASLTVLDGDPGQGKSTLAYDLAARVSLGSSMPPGRTVESDPRGVLLLSAEDDIEYTIRPRLEAADADMSRIHCLDAVRVGDTDRPPVLPYDLELVGDLIRDEKVGLVIVDPFMAYLGSDFDAHKDQDIRRCLHQLKILAKKHNVSILLIRHLNKLNGGPALYRGGGSIGIIGAARAAMVVGRDPQDEKTRILAMNKSNLGPVPRSLAYVLDPMAQDIARVLWVGESDLGPEDILWHQQGKGGRPNDEIDKAKDFLADLLRAGPMDVKEVMNGAKANGITEKTLRRAKDELEVASKRLSQGWCWVLEEEIGSQDGQNSP